ncbi:hypothetical protein [Lactococcus lactis]|uniref:hypothetical protein n=1 Tax=Lactococcus lactis TaxID=1358 RepID=UPI00024D9056|nr:hypothetical protein [Lactococcus lactis]BAL51127.1 exonuclease [Lactococcus lactis subsp. lactis IO-1]
MIQTNTSKKVKEFMKLQQNKIDSWNINVPETFFDNEEKQKVNTMILILKTILINTRDILYAINTLDRENNTAGISILLKTLIENTVDIKYARYFYEKSNLEEVSNVIEKSETYMFGKSVKKKTNQVFDSIDIKGKKSNEKSTTIYEEYKFMCKIAHPDFNQLYSIVRNKPTNYPSDTPLDVVINDKLAKLTLEDKIFASLEHKIIMTLRDELVQIIDTAVNELGNEVTTRYRDTDEVEFDINNGILLPSLTKKGIENVENRQSYN